MGLRILVISLLLAISGQVIAELLVAGDGYLYVPQSENRRLLLTPGELLLKKEIPQEEVYRKRIRVITRGGIEGDVRRLSVDSLSEMQGPIAYTKKTKSIGDFEFLAGTAFPVRIEEEEQGDFYYVTYAKVFYSIKHKDFDLRKKEHRLSDTEFFQYFNIVVPEESGSTGIPYWMPDESQKPTEYGCGDSRTEKTEFSFEAGTSIKASGGFFSFFEAEAEARNDNAKIITYESNLSDPEFRHRIRYFVLKNAPDGKRTLLRVALEKLSLCDSTKGVRNAYVIRFEKNLDYGELTFNEHWAKDNGFERGRGSPLRIDNLADLEKFEQAFKGFKFNHLATGFDVPLAVKQFTVQYAVNLHLAE